METKILNGRIAYTIEGTAKLFSVCKKTIDRRIDAGEIKVIHSLGDPLIPAAEIIRLAESAEVRKKRQKMQKKQETFFFMKDKT